MADKIIKITLDQLNDIVSDAVTNAIKKLDNVEIIEDTPKESSSTVSVGEFSDEQYKEAIETMARNRGAGDEPKVGIFWYNATLKQLFGVVTHKRTDYLKNNSLVFNENMSFQILEEHEGIGGEGIFQLPVVAEFHEEAA